MSFKDYLFYLGRQLLNIFMELVILFIHKLIKNVVCISENSEGDVLKFLILSD